MRRPASPGGSMAPAAHALPRAAAKRLSVEGNIAAGKSTFVGLLRRAFPGWRLTPEPVAKWQEVRAARQGSASPTFGNLLQMIYREPRRWSYTFQSYSCLSRLKAQLESLVPAQSPEAVLVFERSVYSDRYIFAKNLFEIGHMTEIEWIIYQDWHTFLLQTFGDQLALHGFLYLQAPPEVCFERLRCRSRPEEKEVQLSYLEQLHVQHENWLVKKTSVIHSGALRDVPVLILDVTKDFENDPNEQSKLIGQATLTSCLVFIRSGIWAVIFPVDPDKTLHVLKFFLTQSWAFATPGSCFLIQISALSQTYLVPNPWGFVDNYEVQLAPPCCFLQGP